MNSLMLEPKHLASRPSFSAVSVVFRPTHKHEKSSLCSQFQFRIAFSDVKIKIVEVLWSIIYSDTNADVYENNLMRRLTGLLYLDPKIVGNIKKKIINNLK